MSLAVYNSDTLTTAMFAQLEAVQGDVEGSFNSASTRCQFSYRESLIAEASLQELVLLMLIVRTHIIYSLLIVIHTIEIVNGGCSQLG